MLSLKLNQSVVSNEALNLSLVTAYIICLVILTFFLFVPLISYVGTNCTRYYRL